jgi:hyaluronoglucosaminidase
MVVSWAVIGPEDGTALRQLMDAYWQNPNDSNREKLLADLSKIDKSILTLHKELPPKVLKECQPQLEQFRRILQADKLGLEVLAGDQSKQAAFQQAVKEVKAHEPQVLISEKTARAFMDELQQHIEK